MNREIKFRAWWIQEYKMVSWEQILDFEGENYILSGLFTEPKRFIPMQYTGLKDKNGKEIYEGDIVRGPAGRNRVIEWNDKACGFRFKDSNKLMFISSMGDLRVIGNVWENPELLK